MDGAEIRETPAAAPRRRRWSFPLAVAAAFAGGCLSLGLAFWAGDLSRELDAERAERHLVEETALLLADPDTRRIGLDGASGVLVVDDSTGEGWLVVLGLDPAPDARTYEAWVIADGEAVPAGLFTGGERTVVSLTEPVPEGAIVAVTLEEAGGVEQPTQDPVFVTEQPA